jgi:transposase
MKGRPSGDSLLRKLPTKGATMTNDKYVAFDVHLATITFCILDAFGKIIWEGVFASSAQAIRDFLGGIRGRVHLTFEQGTLAAWLYDLVKPLVATVIVCNPRYNRLVLCGNKSDRIDARKLAEQLRQGALRPVYQTQHSLRPLKQLVLGYEALIKDSVRTMCRIKSLFQGRGIPCHGQKLYSPSQHDFWLSKITESGLNTRVKLLFSQLDSLTPLREEAQKNLLAESRKYPAVKLLCKIPCLGPIRSAQIVAVVGTPHRFRTKRQYWPYCGLAVLTRSTSDYEIISGTIRRKKRTPKIRGLNPDYSRILKRVYKSAALQAATDKVLTPLYSSLLKKGLQPAMARLTIARRLSSTSLTLWKKEEKFNAEKFFTNIGEPPKEITKEKKKLSLKKRTVDHL